MSNNTSLYSTTSSGNVTIPPNNNTGLYNSTGVPATVDNNIAITGNISAAGNITGGNILTEGIVSAAGNIYGANFIGNIIGNIQVPGGNTQVLFNNNGAANASVNLTFNTATNILAVGGAVSATGNVTGNYILGNGALLTGLPATYSNANVVSLLSSFGSNTVSTTGNVSAGYFLGDGSQLTNLPAGNYSNANVAAYLPTYTGNITGDQVSLTGNIIANYVIGDGSQLTNLPAGNYSNANVAAYLPTFTGNIAAAAVSATGNITGNFFFGNGSQLTGLPATYSNANVATFLAAFGSNSISTSGNITAGNFAGNGSGLTSITGANVTGTVANATFATSAGTATSATTAGTVTTNAQPNITSVGTLTSVTSTGNITGGNILTGGAVSATGNVRGAFILGDGSQLTNLPVQPGNYSNANVAAYLPVYTGNIAAGNISATGNITATFLKTSGATGNIVGVNYVSANFYLGDGGYLSNIQAGNLVGAYSNANVANYLPTFSGNLTANTISATGNITGNYILGNGSQLTGLPATYGNANVAAYLPTFTGNLLAGNASVTGQVAITTAGNTWRFLNDTFTTPDGGTWTSNTATNDEYINSAPNGYINLAALHANSQIATSFHLEQTVAQIEVDQSLWSFENGNITLPGNTSAINYANGVSILTGIPGTYSNANVANYLPTYSGTITANVVSATGNITGNYIIGNGSQLTGLPAGYSNADVATFLAAFGSNTISTSGNITAGNLIGTVAQANVANLVNVSNANSGSSSGFYVSFASGPGNTQVQIDDVGNGFTYQPSAGKINLTAIEATGQILGNNIASQTTISATGNITGNYFIGNGSQLTGITTTAGGSNTQIQFNDGTAFAGNSNMTFDKTTGTITLGNVAYVGQRILPGTASIGNLSDTSVSANANPWQLIIGNSYNGNANWNFNIFTPGSATGTGPGSRVHVADVYNLSNGGVRGGGMTTSTYMNIQGNVTNSSSRYQGGGFFIAMGGGASGNTMLTTNFGAVQAMGSGITIGNVNANLNIGNTTANYINGYNIAVQCGGGSTVNYLTGYVYQPIPTALTGNIGNLAGFMPNFSTNTSNANVIQVTNTATFYHPGSSGSIIPAVSSGNIVRNATNYHAYRNDDTLAKSRLGSVETMHYWTSNTANTSGSVAINKNNGQYQNLYPTANVTDMTFSNFVTRVQRPNGDWVNQTDVVTLIITQGATPYNITMPTGNSSIRYANSSTVVGNTANSSTIITVTASYNWLASSTMYLIDISPEYVVA